MSKLFGVCQFVDSMTKSFRPDSTTDNQLSVKESLVYPTKNRDYEYLLLSFKWEHLPSAYDQGTTGLGQFMQGKRGLSLFSLQTKHCNLQLQSTSTILNQWFSWHLLFLWYLYPASQKHQKVDKVPQPKGTLFVSIKIHTSITSIIDRLAEKRKHDTNGIEIKNTFPKEKAKKHHQKPQTKASGTSK